jgi:pyruvate dehydrogenase E2 component (dihydrolipoamide acetyltransferase)
MPYEFKLPDIGEGVVEGEIVQWLIQAGEIIEEDQLMVEIMTDKATVEIPSPVAGTVLRIIGVEGEAVAVGTTLVVIEGANQAPPEAAPKSSSKNTGKSLAIDPVPPGKERSMATPAVRQLARKIGIDLATLHGSGAEGRITRKDVERAAASTAPEEGVLNLEKDADSDRIPYRGLRKKIGDHMVASKRFAPHYTYVDEVDVTKLSALRDSLNSTSSETRLSFLPFLVKACVLALKKYPLLNAMLDEENQIIQLKNHYNIGVATATDKGLLVPVLKSAERKTLSELGREIEDLSAKVKSGKAQLADLKGGTFTITSLGALGGIFATPIINYPEVAILGVHKIQPRPIVCRGEIVVREVMNLSLSLDHRVVDGVVGAQFLNEMIRTIEEPDLLSD